MSNTQAHNSIWTPANVITVTRILLVPLLVVALICPWAQWVPSWSEASLWQPWIAALIFALLSGTDALDGHLARSRNEVTDFGKFIDPLADKILVVAALLCLVEMNTLPAWIALIILIREFIISGIRMIAATDGIVIAASWYGKAKTVFQIIAILLFIVKDSHFIVSLGSEFAHAFNLIAWIIMTIAVVLTVFSLVDYFIKSRSLLGLSDNHAASEVLVKVSDDIVAETQECGLLPDCSSDIKTKATEVIMRAQQAHCQISTAESCTGGLIAGALTAVPGSSEVVQGGIVSYSNQIKHRLLHVSEENLQTYGAVSSQVAKQMAEGSRAALNTDVAVSVTGIAGPGGATPTKPVGTVWFGLATDKGCETYLRVFEGDRDAVRNQTVLYALELIEQAL